MGWRRFTVGYVLLTLGALVAAFGAQLFLEVPAGLALLPIGSLVFLASAAVAPQGYLFRLVRNIGWFSAVESDGAAKRLLIALGIMLLAAYVWQTSR